MRHWLSRRIICRTFANAVSGKSLVALNNVILPFVIPIANFKIAARFIDLRKFDAQRRINWLNQ